MSQIDPILRIGRWLGQLSHPFYEEERQRDVWNEAASVGLGTVFMAGCIAAATMVWLRGAEAVTYSMVMIGLVSLSSWATILYANALGVSYVPTRRDIARPQFVITIGALALWIVALIVRVDGDSYGGGLRWAIIAGASLGVLAVVVGSWQENKGPTP